ncbi:large conductance mechanosensitive channel protein MscL [Paenibacillus sp. Mc5Re-14]|uniref:large conductance mechanosensitive channel protein MscL n=1 Tax=Paenibacillus sp. Mc5Re-14 TaxID=1030529 RepID=UPI000AF8B041|nr:large conductance mechanosensitive channel protein MscL [Paenibacillus sp. Mc5Re-14]
MSEKVFIKEFKEFAVRGNVIDLAVGVIIGGAFGKIVTSVVNDIIMPPIGKLLGGMNFPDLYVALQAADPLNADGTRKTLAQAKEAGIAVLAYGQFINVLLDFLIVAFCVFMLVKGINMLKRKEEEKPPQEKTIKECPHCLSEIPIAATRCAHCTSKLEGFVEAR